MQPYYPLDLPVDAMLARDFHPDNHGQDYFTQIYRFGTEPEDGVRVIPGRHAESNPVIWTRSTDVISQELDKFMREHELITEDETGSLFMFYHRSQGRPGPIHCDWGPRTSKTRACWAINWCVAADQDHWMKWWEPVDSRRDDEGMYVTAGRMPGWDAIPQFEPDQVREIAKYTIITPTLVRTDIPHNGYNPAGQPRWVFSLRGRASNTWERAVEWFKPWIQPQSGER
jgi:hypothetical protein